MKTTEKIQSRLLVIEDDKNIPLVLDGWVKKHANANLVIDHALNPEEGLKRADGAACIILDLTIPPIWKPGDTLQLIPKLRQHAPVIVLTGYSTGSDESDAQFAIDAMSDYGADRVIYKMSLIDSEGIGDLMSSVTAAICRRIYDTKHQ
jgi:CheY-like chemotaxis protein